MKRVFSLVAVLALALAPAVAAASSGSITAPDSLHFGDTFMPTVVQPDHKVAPYATTKCFANASTITDDLFDPTTGLLYAEDVYLLGPSAQSGPFRLGPTPSWSGGGADCVVTLNDQRHTYASDVFSVAP